MARVREDERALTLQTLREVTGEYNVSELTCIELAFCTPFSSFDAQALSLCTRLTELTVIGSGVKEIESVAPLRKTLQHLSLPANDISSLANLPRLPNLTQLFLQVASFFPAVFAAEWAFTADAPHPFQLPSSSAVADNEQDNNIASLEGITAAIHLERLWLFSNQICAADELQHLVRLRELWIQVRACSTECSCDRIEPSW